MTELGPLHGACHLGLHQIIGSGGTPPNDCTRAVTFGGMKATKDVVVACGLRNVQLSAAENFPWSGLPWPLRPASSQPYAWAGEHLRQVEACIVAVLNDAGTQRFFRRLKDRLLPARGGSGVGEMDP